MKTLTIEQLINELKEQQAKGCKNVSIKGTIVTDDNSILISTEKQF